MCVMYEGVSFAMHFGIEVRLFDLLPALWHQWVSPRVNPPKTRQLFY